MSPASYKQWGKDNVRLHPVDTGPFKLGCWDQNQIIVLEENPTSFIPGLPYLDRIELRITKESVTRVTRQAPMGHGIDTGRASPRQRSWAWPSPCRAW